MRFINVRWYLLYTKAFVNNSVAIFDPSVYYGNREMDIAMTYLFGSKSVLYYRIVYVAGFFFAAVADTGLIWKVADITIVLMTLPNLIGIIILHKEVRSTIAQYWADFKKEYPDE